jgi:hypothetical protein
MDQKKQRPMRKRLPIGTLAANSSPGFRQVPVKAANPEAYMTGETDGRASAPLVTVQARTSYRAANYN